MIQESPYSADNNSEVPAPFRVVLARYGAVPQVARFGMTKEVFGNIESQLSHGVDLVVKSERGTELARLLEVVHAGINPQDKPVTGDVLRLAAEDDYQSQQEFRRQADLEFVEWQSRIADWQLQLQLIDMERTLDGEQLILYVLNGQDAETTRLALLAAAAGLGIVTVQPVASEGVVQTSGGGGGCGSGGCGSGGCSS